MLFTVRRTEQHRHAAAVRTFTGLWEWLLTEGRHLEGLGYKQMLGLET